MVLQFPGAVACRGSGQPIAAQGVRSIRLQQCSSYAGAPLVATLPPCASLTRPVGQQLAATAGGAATLAAAVAGALTAARRAGEQRGHVSRRASRGDSNAATGTTRRGGLQREPSVAASSGAVAQAAAEQLPTDNASAQLDEWLLAQELPQPLRPILGSSAWANFGAALVQFAVVSGLSALGTFLEQGGPPEFYASKYPAFSGIILTLGFDHMYSAPLFVFLQVWLAASIAACTATTQLPLAKRAQRFGFRSYKNIGRIGAFKMTVGSAATSKDSTVEQPVTSNGGDLSDPPVATKRPEDEAARSRLVKLRASLQQRGFAVRVDEEECPGRLAASRGLVGKFAPIVVHLALLLCLAGGAVGLLFGSSSEVLIKDGGQADMGAVLEQGRRIKGPLYALNPIGNLMAGTSLHVEDFRIEYRDNGDVEQFYSTIAVEDGKTRNKLYGDEIYVNKPLRYGGATVYQADWSLDRLQMYLNGKAIVVPLKQLPDEGGTRLWGAFLPQEIVTAKDPNEIKRIKNPKEGIVMVVENMRNVQVYGSNKALVGILRSPLAKVDRKMEGMPIQFGESIQVEGSELALDRVVGSTGLIVKNDPGVPLVYLGYALLMPATLLSVLPFGQVWAAIGEGDDSGRLFVSGQANRNKPAFEDEVKAIVVEAVA